MNNPSEQPPQPGLGARPTPPSRAWLVWLAVLGGIVLLMLFRDRMDTSGEVITQYRFEELVNSNQIARASINYSPQNPALNEVVGIYYRVGQSGDKTEIPFRAKVRLTSSLERKLLGRPEFEPHEPNTMLMSVAVSLLPFVIIAALIWFFFVRQIRKSTTQTYLQQERLDAVLSKWEEQGRRMDRVLDKMEKDHGLNP